MAPLAPPGSDSSANRLMNDVATGNRDAFAELYAITSTRVFSLIHRMLRNVTAAEEVTQTTYLEVWQLAAQHNPARGGTTMWILAVAHRHAMARVRSSGFAASHTRHGATPRGGDDVELFEDDAQFGGERDRANRALSRLSPAHRDAAVHACWQGLTAREIAHDNAIDVSTVTTRLRDGLITLRAEWSSDRPGVS